MADLNVGSGGCDWLRGGSRGRRLPKARNTPPTPGPRILQPAEAGQMGCAEPGGGPRPAVCPCPGTDSRWRCRAARGPPSFRSAPRPGRRARVRAPAGRGAHAPAQARRPTPEGLSPRLRWAGVCPPVTERGRDALGLQRRAGALRALPQLPAGAHERARSGRSLGAAARRFEDEGRRAGGAGGGGSGRRLPGVSSSRLAGRTHRAQPPGLRSLGLARRAPVGQELGSRDGGPGGGSVMEPFPGGARDRLLSPQRPCSGRPYTWADAPAQPAAPRVPVEPPPPPPTSSRAVARLGP